MPLRRAELAKCPDHKGFQMLSHAKLLAGWAVAIVFFSIVPTHWVIKNLAARDETLSRGEVVTEFWCPKDAKVYTDRGEFQKEFPEDNDDILIAYCFASYKEKLVEEKHHILVQYDRVDYCTRQGRFIVRAHVEPKTGNFVGSDNIGEPVYLGDGKVSFPVTESLYGRRQVILASLLMGLLADVFLAVILFVVFFVVSIFYEEVLRE